MDGFQKLQGGMHMETESRRSFNKKLLGSLTAFGLIETLFARDLFADAVKAVLRKWAAELGPLSRDLKDRKLKDVEFQAKLEELYGRVELPELIKLLDLDRVTKNLK